MKELRKILLLGASLLGLIVLTACTSSSTSSGGNQETESSLATSSQQDLTSSESSESVASTSSTSESDLSNAAIYQYLLDAGYTGVSNSGVNYSGLTDAVQSQSMNYVLIEKVTDVEALNKEFPQFKNLQLQSGQWVYYTSMKVGTLNSLADLKNIQ